MYADDADLNLIFADKTRVSQICDDQRTIPKKYADDADLKVMHADLDLQIHTRNLYNMGG